MASISAADEAYAAALEEIEQVKRAGERELWLDKPQFHALSRIPPEVAGIARLTRLDLTLTQVSDLTPLAGLTGLTGLFLNRTQISDLTPLTGLTGLTRLDLDQTQVSDLTPLAGLTGLTVLWLTQTQVSDLRPIRALPFDGGDSRPALWFSSTPATRTDAELARLAEIKDATQRTRETLAYLKTLPPWPKPYTPAARPDGIPPQPIGGAPIPPRDIRTAARQIHFLLNNALVTRTTADQFATQIETALRGVPVTRGNELPPVLQMMADVAVVLRHLAPNGQDHSRAIEESALRLQIAHLEDLVINLRHALADESKAREAAEALARRDNFWTSVKRGAGEKAGAWGVGLVGVGAIGALTFFLGSDHKDLQGLLTVFNGLKN